ncbi:MAG: hypothetical protein CME62_05365 [Halobacteriovoraceae bacterium]|nr:hypothetical protein [Halobacteriovoraceae bacterium]|tara:strand:- start:25181 stop:28306 length:3126 start_codon:yes stop_codon:yes gene_type:complete
MKKNSLFIIPMLAPALFISSAQANLPDEINYSPYERSYNLSGQKVETLTASLNRAQSELQTAYNNESNLTAQIEQLEINIARTNSQIENHILERDQLIVDSQNLDNDIRRIENRLSRAEGRRAELERTIDREQRKLRPFKQKLEQLQQQLGEANRKVTRANDKLKNLKSAQASAQRNLQTARQAKTNLENQLKTQEATLANLDKLLSNAQKRVQNLETQLSETQTQKITETQKLTAITQEITELMQQMRGLPPRGPQAREIRQKIAQKSVEKRAQEKVVSRINQQAASLTRQVTQAKGTVASLKNQQTTLPQSINQTKTQITNAQKVIRTRRSELEAAKTNVENQQARVNSLVTEANIASAEVNAQKEEVIRRSGPLNQAMSNLGNVNDRIRTIGENLRVASNDYNTVLDKIKFLDREIPNLRRSSADMNRELRSANTDLIVAQDQIITLNSDVTILSSDLRAATNDRDIKYQEYIVRYNLYTDKLNEAKTLGISQTDVALSIAREDSHQYVVVQANKLGTVAGTDMAQAQAQYWGAIRAEIKGYNDGYNQGYASDSDQMRGQEEGTRAGIKAAQDYAQTVLKPKYFTEIFAEALKTGKMQKMDQVTFSQAGTQKSLNQSLVKNVMEFFGSVSPISANEINQSLDITTDLDTKINTFQSNLSAAQTQQDNYSLARNTYTAPTIIPFQNYDCSQVYKDLAVFEKACANEYEKVFSSKYLREHQENYYDQYPTEFTTITEDTRDSKIEALYNQTMDDLYPIANAKGLSDGKDQIYKETFALAKNNAYNNELPNADAVAKAQAGNEVQTWVSNNASLTIDKAAIIGTELRGGSPAKIRLALKNISPVALDKPLEVVITNAQNAEFASRTFFIKSADANTTTNFEDISFNVSAFATSGSQIKIQGKVKLPGGKYEASREESFEVEALTVVNPKLNYNGLDYDSTPKIKGIFNYYTHAFNANIAAAVEDIKDGYTVTLKPVSGYESLIKMQNTSVFTGKMTRGTNNQMRFVYSFPKAADNKVVKLELKYLFKGRVMKSEIIELRPH